MEESKFTVGDLMERLETEFFPNPKDDFEKLCKERESSIKKFIGVAHRMVIQHVDYRTTTERKLSYWEDNRIDEHIKNLSVYIELLGQELNRERIEGHCKHKDRLLFSVFDSDYIFLVFNSLHSTIISDIMWFSELSVYEAVELSLGELDPNTLGKYLPMKIDRIEKDIMPFLKTSEKYGRHVESIEEVVKCYKHNLYKACNLLLMTTIEGLVRDLCSFLSKMQGLNLDINDPIFNSLDNLLRKGGWKNDYEIRTNELNFIKQSKPPTITNYSIPYGLTGHPVPSIDQKEKINLKTRLDFLRSRFKENRDLILHGTRSEYGSKWHLYVSFSCLTQVYKTLTYYDELYA